MNSEARIIRTELSDGRVRLRQYAEAEAEAVWEAVAESRGELRPWMAWCTPEYGYQDVAERIAGSGELWARGEVYAFVALDEASGGVVGGCGFNALDPVNLRANLGYWVRTGRTGEGLGTAAARLALRFGFEDLGLRRIEVIPAVENLASQRVAQKLGAARECVLRGRLRVQGRLHDAVSYAVVRDTAGPRERETEAKGRGANKGPGPAEGRVRLRRWEAADAGAVWAAVEESRRELGRWMSWCGPDYSYADCEGFSRARDACWERGSEHEFIIENPDTGELLGCCGLNQIDHIHRRANLGYWVRTGRTGRGVAAAAARELMRFGFEDLGLKRIEIVPAVENLASRRVAEKAGAMREGILRGRLRLADGQHDAVSFAAVCGKPEEKRREE